MIKTCCLTTKMQIVFIVVIGLCGHVSAFKRPYAYVCDDSQLYKPYVMAYEGGRGGTPIDLGSNIEYFYYLGKTTNVYVCINGPAYLYFSNTTALGLVFDSPQMQVYDHICEMYNVPPGSGAINKLVNRTLQAIQLMGDRRNYLVNPALQLFTAPYWHPVEKLYVNATSLIVFNNDVCFLNKNDETIMIVPPDALTDPPPATPRYCKLGYSNVVQINYATGDLKPSDATPPNDDAQKVVRDTLRNDHAIRNAGCGAAGWLNSSFLITKAVEKLNQTVSELENKFKNLVNPSVPDELRQVAVVKAITDEIADIDAQIGGTGNYNSPATGSKKLKLENLKKKKEILLKEAQNLQNVHTQIQTYLPTPREPRFKELDATEVGKKIEDLDGKLKDKLKNEQIMVEEKQKELEARELLEKEPWNFKAHQDTIKKARDAYTEAVSNIPKTNELVVMWTAIQEIVKKAADLVAELQVLFKEKGKNEGPPFSATAAPFEPLKVLIEKAVATTVKPQIIKIEDIETNCTLLPQLNDTCTKGKPNEEDSCKVFQASLGYEPPAWTPDDNWKSDILDSMDNIFSSACFRVTKKFTRNVFRIFKHYLTDAKYFNNRHDISATTLVTTTPATGAAGSPLPNHVRRDFWKHIQVALQECEKNKTRNMLFFNNVDKANDSAWEFIKRNEDGSKESVPIFFHQEQAEKEYYFNWVIDWQYKIFATVLGLCMPGYETKIPLITSRFYAMYTEDFVIPLRDIWVNSKDNQVFNWILGEFKHSSDVDIWLSRCMESSFIQANKIEYRPLRCLLINGGTEHNYFLNGVLAGKTHVYTP